MQQQSGMGVIFITHDLGVVAEIADRTIVMYKGEIVEQNTVQQIFTHPQHPYTKGLLACRPVLHEKGERLPVVSDFLEEKKSRASEVKIRLLTKNEKPITRNESTSNETTSTLLKVENLSVWFPSKKTFLGKPLEYTKAVDDVSFEI